MPGIRVFSWNLQVFTEKKALGRPFSKGTMDNVVQGLRNGPLAGPDDGTPVVGFLLEVSASSQKQADRIASALQRKLNKPKGRRRSKSKSALGDRVRVTAHDVGGSSNTQEYIIAIERGVNTAQTVIEFDQEISALHASDQQQAQRRHAEHGEQISHLRDRNLMKRTERFVEAENKQGVKRSRDGVEYPYQSHPDQYRVQDERPIEWYRGAVAVDVQIGAESLRIAGYHAPGPKFTQPSKRAKKTGDKVLQEGLRGAALRGANRNQVDIFIGDFNYRHSTKSAPGRAAEAVAGTEPFQRLHGFRVHAPDQATTVNKAQTGPGDSTLDYMFVRDAQIDGQLDVGEMQLISPFRRSNRAVSRSRSRAFTDHFGLHAEVRLAQMSAEDNASSRWKRRKVREAIRKRSDDADMDVVDGASRSYPGAGLDQSEGAELHSDLDPASDRAMDDVKERVDAEGHYPADNVQSLLSNASNPPGGATSAPDPDGSTETGQQSVREPPLRASQQARSQAEPPQAVLQDDSVASVATDPDTAAIQARPNAHIPGSELAEVGTEAQATEAAATAQDLALLA